MRDIKKIKDILESLQAITRYRVESYDDFVSDSKTQEAILFNLIIIGEAANQISNQFKEKYPSLPWSSMIGTRNVIVHGYDQVRLPIIWEIIKRDLDVLQDQVIHILEIIS